MLSERFEYILKGVFLGLLLFVAINALGAPTDPSWTETQRILNTVGRTALFMAAGLVAALVIALIRQFRDLGKLATNPLGFFIFLLLENPFFIYCGIVLGLGTAAVTGPEAAGLPDGLMWYCVGGGAVLGYGFGEMRLIKDNWYRATVPVAAMIVIGYLLAEKLPTVIELGPAQKNMLAAHILMGLPFFYLLTFTGVAEESEVEIAALCGALGLSIDLLGFAPWNMPALGFLLPVTLYFVYAVYVLPGLRVFKHTLRGYSYMQPGTIDPALIEFRRALQLDRKNQLAQRGLWHLHKTLDLDAVARDPRILEMLDPNQVLSRVGELLSERPTQAKVDESAK